jgi:hypothetical protein
MVAVAVGFPPHGEIVSNRCSGCSLLALAAKRGHGHQFIAAIAHDLAGGNSAESQRTPTNLRWSAAGLLGAGS